MVRVAIWVKGHVCTMSEASKLFEALAFMSNAVTDTKQRVRNVGGEGEGYFGARCTRVGMCVSLFERVR